MMWSERKSFSYSDVIGVVKSVSDMQKIVSKASQKEFSKRDILLVDEKASISVALWGQQVIDADFHYFNKDSQRFHF